MCSSLHIVLVVLMVQSSFALRCFECDSDSDPNCVNMSGSTLVSVECEVQRQMDFEIANANNNRLWLLKASDLLPQHPKNEVSEPMVCQKIIAIDENSNEITVRRCQLERIHQCNFSRDSVEKVSREIKVCKVCKDIDGCNGASTNQMFGMLMSFVLAVSLFKNFVF